MTSDITPITAVSLGGTTAQTALEIPDCVTMITPVGKRSIDALAEYAADLLAENSDLPAPVYFSVSEAGQEVSLQFADTPDSFRALAEWAERFGGTITGCPHPRDNGRQSVHCEVKFTDRGVKVEAYAFITALRPHPLRPDTSAGPGGRQSPGPASHQNPSVPIRKR
jgi:hypothetical protein